MRRWVWLCGLLWSAPAAAHHVVSDSGIAWVEPVTVAEVTLEAATFDQGAWRVGSWQVMAASAQYAPLPWLSGSLRAPVAFVRYEDGRAALGLGDVEVGARVRLWETPHGGLIASAGLGAELPTGDEAVGLGGGHLELSPYVVASAQPLESLLLIGVASGRISLGGEAHDGEIAAHGAVIAPHAPREVYGRLNAAWVEEDWIYGSAGIDVSYMIGAFDRTPWVARAEVGYLGIAGLRLALGVEQAVAGEARHGLKGRMSAAWIF